MAVGEDVDVSWLDLEVEMNSRSAWYSPARASLGHDFSCQNSAQMRQMRAETYLTR